MEKKSKITLHIDTSTYSGITVRLLEGVNIFEKVAEGQMSAQKTLMCLESLLRTQRYTPDQISNITFHTGPGSYTGLRIGAVIAQTIGLLMGIPVNEADPQKPHVLRYQ